MIYIFMKQLNIVSLILHLINKLYQNIKKKKYIYIIHTIFIQIRRILITTF